MKTLKHLAVISLFIFSFSCTNTNEKNHTTEIKNEIESYLTKAMELHNIPGLALAVVEKDQIVYKNYFGKASLEDDRPVNENTLFRVYSTTKLITTTGIFQLIESGDLNLEDTISKHLDHLPSQWQDVKVKNLLSHSSGLPDIIWYESTLSDEELMDELADDEMEFPTGSQFRYNQTNYWLLAQIIEKITRMSFDKFILENQFDNSANGVLFSSNSQEVIPNRATRYHYSGRTKQFVPDTRNDGIRGHAGNGLNISLNQFLDWDKQLNNNRLLGEEAKSSMWSPFKFTNNFKYQKDNFLHGWHNYAVNNLGSYGFTGGNLSGFRKFTKNDVTIILLSNGYEIPAYDIIVNDVARMVIPELRTKDLTLEEEVMSLALNSQFDQALLSFKRLKQENPNSLFDNLKWNINHIGNSYTWQDEPEKAFQVFKLNAEVNPDWWVASAGLAEMYEAKNDTLNALKSYRKAISLNEKNEGNYNEDMMNRINKLVNN